MTAAVEALGLTLPGASSIPAVDAEHARMAAACGRLIVELVWHDRTPGDILGPASFDNAITTVLALGGSTNSVIHLIAIARRAGVDLTLDRFDELSRATPVLADIRPSGALPDGGLLLRGRPARAARPAARPVDARRAVRRRGRPRAKPSPAPRYMTRP